MEPEPLEQAIQCSPLVKQCVVVGQDQRHLGALIVPDYDYLGALAEEQGRADGFTHKEIEDRMYKEVRRVYNSQCTCTQRTAALHVYTSVSHSLY